LNNPIFEDSMKRLSPQRMTSFLPKPKSALAVQQLESRDVPAVFFVDPNYDGVTPNAAHFSGAAAGPASGATPANTFVGTAAGFGAALAAAAADGEADTIYFANGDSVAPNVGGAPIVVNDQLTFVGSGNAAGQTRIIVGFPVNPASPAPPGGTTGVYGTSVFEVGSGNSLNLQDLAYAGSGVAANAAFQYDGGTGTITNSVFTGFGTGYNNNSLGLGYNGEAVWVRGGANVTVTGSSFTNTQGRTGIYVSSGSAAQSILTATGSTFTGNGSGSDRVNLGIEIAANAQATITGNTFTNNLATLATSAGIFMYGGAGFGSQATILRNTFTNNEVGAIVGSNANPANNATDKTSALLAYNSFTGDTVASIQGNPLATAAGAVINARFNWFGSASGPVGTNNVQGIVNASQFLQAPLGTAVPNESKFITGANVSAGNAVKVYSTNSTITTATPAAGVNSFSPANAGEGRVAYADITGDGVRDVIIGSSTSDLVQVYNGATGALIDQFAGLQTITNKAVTNFAGGVYVAAGDINADGKIDVVVSQGAYDPRIVVYNGVSVAAGSSAPTKLRDFEDGYNRGSISMGVSVAVGDFNGDGYDDIATAVVGFANSNVRVYDGKFLTTGAQAGMVTGRSVAITPGVDFYAYLGYAVTANIAAGDVNGDGRADLVTGAASLGANVRVFDFAAGSLLAPQTFASATSMPTLDADFYAGADNTGVRVAARDLNNDGYADILFTPGNTGTGNVPVYGISGSSLTAFTPYINTIKAPPPIATTLLAAAYGSTGKGGFVA
jgi:hypothetical protein